MPTLPAEGRGIFSFSGQARAVWKSPLLRGEMGMIRKLVLPVRKLLSGTLRKLFNFLPRERRFAVYRNFVDCDPAPNASLELKIADTKEELEACFTLLHDAYVGSKFMNPDPSGMRVTIYHALPTTTTLCAKYDGEVVGTLSPDPGECPGLSPAAHLRSDGTAGKEREHCRSIGLGDTSPIPSNRRQHSLPADEIHVRILHHLL